MFFLKIFGLKSLSRNLVFLGVFLAVFFTEKFVSTMGFSQ